MSSREIVLRLDERWYKALNRHLKNETLEEHMEDVLDELCNQLPQREYERISREIWQEDQEKRQAREAEQKIAVFHVTENGEGVYFSVAESMELLQTAVHLRNCLSDENADGKFASTFPRGEKITQEQFDAAAAERMENTGRVTGAYELDFDARTFSALNIIGGWKVYAMQDVVDAARQAFQAAEVSEHERWCIFIDRLDGQELTTPSRLTARNFYFEDTIEVMDNRTLNFYMVPCFNVDEAFGTFVETNENDHMLNVYANYDMQRQRDRGTVSHLPPECGGEGRAAHKDGCLLHGTGTHVADAVLQRDFAGSRRARTGDAPVDCQPVPRRRTRVGGLCGFRSPAKRVAARSLKTGRCADVRERSAELQRRRRNACGRLSAENRAANGEAGQNRGVVRAPRRSHLPAVRAVSGFCGGVVAGAKIAPLGSERQKVPLFQGKQRGCTRKLEEYWHGGQ